MSDHKREQLIKKFMTDFFESHETFADLAKRIGEQSFFITSYERERSIELQIY